MREQKKETVMSVKDKDSAKQMKQQNEIDKNGSRAPINYTSKEYHISYMMSLNNLKRCT